MSARREKLGQENPFFPLKKHKKSESESKRKSVFNWGLSL
jgi:hypothetical protein